MSVTLAAAAGAAATAVFVVATLAGEIDSAIRSKNMTKARKIAKRIDAITRQYNLDKSDLESALNQHNLSYNKLISNLEYVSPAGTAWKIKNKAVKDDQKIQQQYLAKQKQLDENYTVATNALQQQQAEYENKGLYDVLGGIIK